MTKQEILQPLSVHYGWTERHQQRIENAMDEYAKQEAIDFFKWYGVKMATFIEYITKIKPIVESNEIEEKIIEFEGKSIQELYELYLKSKNQK